jgi:hypothetical protein
MPPSEGIEASLLQLAPLIKGVIDRIKPIVDQPIVRFPFSMALRTSAVIGAGLSGQVLTGTDFSNALEYPFEVERIKFSQDPAHTFRDWRVNIKDQIFTMDWMKTQAMVALLVNDDTGAWKLTFPWVVRPKGGALTITVDNLDTINPITVDINFIGSLLIPRT